MVINTKEGKMEIDMIPAGKLSKKEFEEILSLKILGEYFTTNDLPTEADVHKIIDEIIEEFD